MFIAALFTIAKTCKQPGRPLTEEQIKKVRYLWQLDIAQQNGIKPFAATWLDLEEQF